MRIAVVGAGGVGGLLAAELSRAGAHEVVLVARGAALAAVRADGLRLETPEGVTSARPALVVAEPGQAGPCDVTLVAVKAWQVPALAPSLAPLLAGGGVVVPLQNGVEAAGRLAAALPPAQVAGGVVWVYAWAERPGVIRRNGLAPRVVCGPRPGAPVGPALEALAVALRHAGVRAEVVADAAAATWEKALLIGTLGLVGAVARAPAGAIRATPEARALLLGLMEEVAAVGRASGVALAPDLVARTLAFVDGVPAGSTASMQRDLGAGRPSELDDQAGAILRAARAAGVAAPLHQALLAALLPQERAARGEAPAFDRT
ncbi:MAG: 2-dehydropantoate 2-reductase [Anaeromyxobacter sp.]|nr:2-dehydropantoate 2-reductase [Anaeromyxobacter sp.]MBL0277142.1 2-dehydropantoate 2-reductase [Anaeromyxobacter sp.]